MTRDGLTGITIRNEAARDFSEVERLTREAFWNVPVPGCSSITLRISCGRTATLFPNSTLWRRLRTERLRET